MLHFLTVSQRISLLKALKSEIKRNEKAIYDAIYKDFGKCQFEAFITEYNFVMAELNQAISKTMTWTKPKSVWPSLLNFPAKEYIISEPYGKVLVISPWNYPFQLAMVPVIMAISAGNQVTLKPSEVSFYTSEIVTKIIQAVFDVKQVNVLHGDGAFTAKLLSEHWDYIFFTGSTKIGKIVAKAAAEHLTPITLELGGKNPTIIHHTANLKMAAKRIVWAKFVNAGQTCIAPDYVLVDAKEKFNFIQYLKEEIIMAFGENPSISKDYARIINHNHFDRLIGLLKDQKILYGGESIDAQKYIAPTIVDEPTLTSNLMTDEIFGPILPILAYESFSDLERIIQQYEKPLALYVFAKDDDFSKKVTTTFSFGGGCINDCMLHFVNKNLPFGGVGHSGMGAYHGKFGFDTFSHQKAMLKKPILFDVPVRYFPYKNKYKWFRKVVAWMS
jgi:aldehyde dehydrogenase (NAD+)